MAAYKVIICAPMIDLRILALIQVDDINCHKEYKHLNIIATVYR